MIDRDEIPRTTHMTLRLSTLAVEGRQGFSFPATPEFCGDLELLEGRGLVRIVHRGERHWIAAATTGGRALVSRLDAWTRV